ncbi:MAG: PLDc N-terminal domain-containing protein [Lacibacter sp.]
MSRSKKVFLGILSVLPVILTIGLLIYLFAGFLPQMITLDQQYGNDVPPMAVLSHVFGFVLYAIILSLFHLGLLIYFIIHAINNKSVKPEERIIWVLVFIFISTVGFVVYWAIRIWPDEKKEEVSPASNFVRMD